MNRKHHSANIPDVLLIGAQKAGTTSLFDWISQHPQVLSNPASKDFPFFWHDENYEKGVELLIKFFPERRGELIVLAGNVNDMFFEQAAERIHNLNPAMRLVICLRNPIERAYSAYNYAVERGLEHRTFSSAIKDELQGICDNDIVSQSQKKYVAHGYYWTQLQRIMLHFEQSQIHTVLFEDLTSTPQQVVQEIFTFLGINEDFIPCFEKKNTTKGGARFARLNALLFKYTLQQPRWYCSLKELMSSNLRFTLRKAFNKVNRKRVTIPPADRDTVRILRTHYQAEIDNLSSLLKRDLTGWLT